MSILDICYIPFNNYAEGKIQLKGIMEMNSLRKMFLDFYDTKVFLKKMLPIEELPKDVKIELWEMANEFQNKETRIEACKVLWVMNYMAENKNKL
jgi:hypothetical protein